MCDDVYTRLSQNSFNSPVLFVHAHHQLRRMLLQMLPDPRNCGPVQKYKQHRWFKVTAIYIERNYVRNTAFSLSRKGGERIIFFKHYPISARESTLCGCQRPTKTGEKASRKAFAGNLECVGALIGLGMHFRVFGGARGNCKEVSHG